MVGADIRNGTVEIATKNKSGETALQTLPLEAFRRRYRSRPFLLAVPLKAMALQPYTAEVELPPEELRLLAEAQTRYPFVLALRAGEKQTVYHLLGTLPPPEYPKATLAPRFLAYWAELGKPDGVFVYSEPGESLVGLVHNGYWRIIRTFVGEPAAPPSLVGEVERLLRYAQNQGMDNPTIYVPEPVAMDYAPLAERGLPVEVYLPEGLGALGLLRLEEGYFFLPATPSKGYSLGAPSSLGTLLLVLGVALLGLALGQHLYLRSIHLSLGQPYREALEVEREHRLLKGRLEAGKGVLANWTRYKGQVRNEAALGLLDSLALLSTQEGVGLKGLTLDIPPEGAIRGSLEGKAKTSPVAYLEYLRQEDRSVALRIYNREGVLRVEMDKP